jgi:hypothetical protein
LSKVTELWGFEMYHLAHLWAHDNPHRIVKSKFRRFYVNVLFGVIGDKLVGLYVFPQHLTGGIYAGFLQT